MKYLRPLKNYFSFLILIPTRRDQNDTTQKFFTRPHSILMAVGVTLILSACADAPRENPLDPHSPNYKSNAAITGKVYVLNQNTPISQAYLTWVESGTSVVTDSNGNYQFSKIDAGLVTIVCSKENFVPDTQKTVLEAGSSREISFGLNGSPYVFSQKILTRKIDQYYPSPQYFVEIDASVGDPNGITDVDSVWFVVNDTVEYRMDYSPSAKLFQTTIFKYDFPTNTIQWLVGKPLTIRSKDRLKAIGNSAPFAVTRIIENGATPTSPTPLNSDTTGPTPVLMWTPPAVTFTYTYTLSVARVDAGTETVVWTYSGLDFFNEQIQFPFDGSGQTLPSANYVWTISVVDEFGNYCRSKEASFVVR